MFHLNNLRIQKESITLILSTYNLDLQIRIITRVHAWYDELTLYIVLHYYRTEVPYITFIKQCTLGNFAPGMWLHKTLDIR